MGIGDADSPIKTTPVNTAESAVAVPSIIVKSFILSPVVFRSRSQFSFVIVSTAVRHCRVMVAAALVALIVWLINCLVFTPTLVTEPLLAGLIQHAVIQLSARIAFAKYAHSPPFASTVTVDLFQNILKVLQFLAELTNVQAKAIRARDVFHISKRLEPLSDAEAALCRPTVVDGPVMNVLRIEFDLFKRVEFLVVDLDHNLSKPVDHLSHVQHPSVAGKVSDDFIVDIRIFKTAITTTLMLVAEHSNHWAVTLSLVTALAKL